MTIPEPKMAVLSWQVIETNPIATWIIAAFDLQEDAEAFAAAKNERATATTSYTRYTVREDPKHAADREYAKHLFRPDSITELLSERDV